MFIFLRTNGASTHGIWSEWGTHRGGGAQTVRFQWCPNESVVRALMYNHLIFFFATRLYEGFYEPLRRCNDKTRFNKTVIFWSEILQSYTVIHAGCRIETYRSPEKFTNKNTQSARTRIYFRIKQRRRPLIANIAAFPQKYRQHLSVSTCLPCTPVTGTLQANNQTSLHYVWKIHFGIYNACQEIRPVCDCKCVYVFVDSSIREVVSLTFHVATNKKKNKSNANEPAGFHPLQMLIAPTICTQFAGQPWCYRLQREPVRRQLRKNTKIITFSVRIPFVLRLLYTCAGCSPSV